MTAMKSAAQDDDDIIARCHAGEAAAFRELYHAHRIGVFRVVARMVTNDADREEVTQDVFLQVFRSLRNFKGNAKLSTWIHRIAMNVILQYIRRKKSRVRLNLEQDISQRAVQTVAGTVAITPEQSAIQNQRRAAVERALSALTPKKRAALVLYDFEGLPAIEIAKIVDASVLTVRTRLFYARKEFYAQLNHDPACADLNLEEESAS